MALAIYVNSDTLIELSGLVRSATGSYVNDATATMTLKDADEKVIASGVSMPYVDGSNGKYQGTLQNTLSVTAGNKYFLEITATRGGETLFKRILCYATYSESGA